MHILPSERYGTIHKEIERIPFNCLFARSVLEHHVTGRVFVDDREDPRAWYILHPYGLSLLYGDTDDDAFIGWLKGHMTNADGSRDHHEWLQVYPDTWNERVENLVGPRMVLPFNDLDMGNNIVRFSRANFEFDREGFQRYLGKGTKGLPEGYEMVDIDDHLFYRIEGLVIPRSFWDNAKDFLERGFGFCILRGKEIVSWSYTVWVHGDLYEIGIETTSKYRGLGFSEILSVEFIKDCMKRGIMPVWSCRFENRPSYNLALKLGFRETARVPYYGLCERIGRP